MFMIQSLLYFWLCHPAFFYGISCLIGVFFQLKPSIWLILPSLSLWFPFLFLAIYRQHFAITKHLLLSFSIFLSAYLLTASSSRLPSLPSDGLTGIAHVKIKSLHLQSTPFGKRWVYRCEIKQFLPDHESHSITLLPCTITLPEKMKHSRPLANQDYWISGTLTPSAKGPYFLKVSSKTLWIPIPKTGSWAEDRYLWKKKTVDWIHSQFQFPLSASFLAGLATGEFDDYWMRKQFSRFGLQHLLAISGFHFAIIAGFLSLTLRLFLPLPIRILSLLILLGAYCFFLGPQPSILRAWIMCSLTLIGTLLEKQTTALNSLGIALLILLGWQPLFCLELGFQLSFAATAAILLFYPPIQAGLYEVFPKRNISEVLQMNQWNQLAYCLLAFLRQGFALTLAVNAFALPLTLYYFQQFPWMSLFYNLFYPFLASGSLCLFLLGTLFSFFPVAANLVHGLNDYYTYFLLQLTYQIPSEIDTYFTMNSLHPAWLILYFCLASLAGMIWKETSSHQDPKETFYFI